MAEFEVGGHIYRTSRKLDVFVQNNIVRRFLPALGGIAGALSSAAAATDTAAFSKAAGEEFLSNLEPITQALAKMSDADADFVLKACLATVVRQQGGGTGWSNVLAPGGGLMFDDIDLGQMYRLVWEVLRENLSGFFSSIGQMLPAPAKGAA